MLAESLGLGVNVEITAREASTGRVLSRQRIHNLVPDVGLNAIAAYLAGTTSAIPGFFAVGTGTTAAAAGDTALQTEVFRDATTQLTPNPAQLNIQYYLDTPSANGYTLTEAGLFTAASGGILLAHGIFTGIAKTSAITVTFSWNLNLAAS